MEAAYGFPAFGGRFTGSPHVGLGLATGARDYSVGWRLAPETATTQDLSFGLRAPPYRRASETGGCRGAARTAGGLRHQGRRDPGERTIFLRLHLMKYGPEPNHWNEYILCAYTGDRKEAIFLTGIPDIRESLPHAPADR